MGAPDVVIVPLRSFAATKTRLAPALAPAERERLTRRLAHGVVTAASDARGHDGARIAVLVVTDDDGVAAWAPTVGASVHRPASPGLDAAAAAGRDWARDRHAAQVAVVHADLADPSGLAAVLGAALAEGATGTAATLVPDRRRDGTNVLVLPSAAQVAFRYGPGSFQRHLAAVAAAGLDARVVDDTALGWDVDTPDDLEALTDRSDPPN